MHTYTHVHLLAERERERERSRHRGPNPLAHRHIRLPRFSFVYAPAFSLTFPAGYHFSPLLSFLFLFFRVFFSFFFFVLPTPRLGAAAHRRGAPVTGRTGMLILV